MAQDLFILSPRENSSPSPKRKNDLASSKARGGTRSCGTSPMTLKKNESVRARTPVVSPSSALRSQFSVTKCLAKGTFGDVYLARRREDDQMFVIKKIVKERLFRIEREVDALSRLDHRSIPRLHRVFEDDKNSMLVLDHVEGLDLFTFYESHGFSFLPEVRVRKLSQQLCHIVHYVHSEHIVHRDLKMENIMIDGEDRISLIDFGLCEIFPKISGRRSSVHSLESSSLLSNVNAQELSPEITGRKCFFSNDWSGSLEYVAPEILARVSNYDAIKAEVYSLGVTIFCLLFSQFPYTNQSRMRGIEGVRFHPQIIFPANANRSKDPIDLLTKMLQNVPEERITMKEVINHPWIRGLIVEQ